MKRITTALVLVWVLLSGATLYAMDSQKINQLEKKITALKEEIDFWRNTTADESIVFVMSLGVPVHMSLDQYGAWLVERRNIGGWTDKRIAEHQVDTANFSRAYREKLRTDFIPQLENELSDLRSQLRSSDEPSNEKWESPVMPFDLFAADNLIGGDWILPLDGHDNIIYVRLDEQRGLLAGSLSVNHLKYFQQGEILFEVTPVKDLPNRFQGTEFSYDRKGVKVKLPLSLEVKDNVIFYSTRNQALKLIRR